MNETLAAPVTGIRAAQSLDGRSGGHAATVGFNASDYLRQINDLADQQNALDAHENATRNRAPGAHAVHEKMVAAAANLKAIIVRETDCQSYPNFSLKIEPAKASNPDRVALTLRIDGIMDRKQATTVMGALVRAFNLKRRGRFSTADDHDDCHEVCVGGDGFTGHVDNLTESGMEKLLDNLSAPLKTIMGGSTVHLGAVDKPVVSHGMSNV